MSHTVHVSGLPLTPLTEVETESVIRNEMRRRAWDKFCADYGKDHPGEAIWFINDDACAELKTWEHS